MNKKKILITATVDIHIKAFHLPYLKMFKEMGYEVHVATNGEEQFEYCDKKYVIPFERSPINFNNIKAIKKLREIMEQEKYDIVHCHTPMGSVVTRIAARKTKKNNGTRIIYTAHGFHFYKGSSKLNWMIFYPIEKFLSKYVDDLITINLEDYNLAKRKFSAQKVHYVPGVGIDIEKFKNKISEERKQELYNELKVNEDDCIIFYVAELSKRKNQLMLIKAMNGIKKQTNNVKLLLAGKGKMLEEYIKLIEKLNLQDNIQLLGFRNDVQDIMKISDIYVSTSRQEGLPVNILEAMACPVPIIATNCRGNRDLIENDINGYLVNIDDVEELQKRIMSLKDDIEKNDCFNKNNEEKCKIYSIDNLLNIMKNIYLEKGESEDVSL